MPQRVELRALLTPTLSTHAFMKRIWVQRLCRYQIVLTHSTKVDIEGLVQESHNSIANALELRLSCINPSICETGLIFYL